MSLQQAECVIEVYTFEGGTATVDRRFIHRVEVSRNIHEPSGRFEIFLQPGGPGGTNSTPTWTQLITPMSMVIIGMRRGEYVQIVMIGVVTASEDAEVWTRGSAARTNVISGTDFSYFFNTFNFYGLGFLGATAGAVTGEGSIFQQTVALPELISREYLADRPDRIGVRFFNQIMVGERGILANTFVPYANGARLKLRDAMGIYAETYGKDVTIPDTSTFILTEGSWTNKFLTLFPFPFYEYFVTTAPLNHYGKHISEDSDPLLQQSAGYPFKLKNMPDALPSSPQLVARVNPTPTFSVTTNGFAQGFNVHGMEMFRWAALPTYSFTAGPITLRSGWSVDEVRNFYMLNPVAMRSLAGDTNTATVGFGFATIGAADPASINRYGYRPEITATNWFYDPTGATLQNPLSNIALTVSALLARVCAHHEPTPFMSRGEATINLRPDILIGGKFVCYPYKNQPSWDFYVEGVRHTFDFENQSATTNLNLSRGLPSSVYADSGADGILQALHLNNAQRDGTKFKIGLPTGTGPGLVSFGTGSDMRTWLGSLTPGFTGPQKP